jgi:putative ubiquitin-RnfH superfamily antitoxin RatB of RatAB toxin-antitoxin module
MTQTEQMRMDHRSEAGGGAMLLIADPKAVRRARGGKHQSSVGKKQRRGSD